MLWGRWALLSSPWLAGREGAERRIFEVLCGGEIPAEV